MSSYMNFLTTVLANPPDPNEPLPLSNRSTTIYASTLTFLLISWIAVIFRLWVRVRVVREPGWDDIFVFLAQICNTMGTICVCLSVKSGLGHHMLYLSLPTMEQYLFLLYMEKSIYMTETALIKISLLLQYLRIFKAGIMRHICILLIVLVTVWGLGFFVVGWFPCFPVRGAWIRTINATCYGFGYSSAESFATIYLAHSASNMAFDLVIFLIPLVLFGTPNLRLKNVLAMTGVFVCGATVVALAIGRLYAIAKNRAGTYPYIDFTWWAPIMVVLSALEIDLAIMCASMPIFWPVIEKSLAAIFVSYQVEVVEEHIDPYSSAYELEHRKAGDGSLKSGSGGSIQELIRDEELGGGELGREYRVGVEYVGCEGHVSNVKTAIHSKPKPKWEL